jgi:hypothetical protein
MCKGRMLASGLWHFAPGLFDPAADFALAAPRQPLNINSQINGLLKIELAHGLQFTLRAPGPRARERH